MKKNLSGIISLLLALVLLAGIIPVTVAADSQNEYLANVDGGPNTKYFTFGGTNWCVSSIASMTQYYEYYGADGTVTFKFTGTGISVMAGINTQINSDNELFSYHNDNVTISIDGGDPQPLKLLWDEYKVASGEVFSVTDLEDTTHTAVITTGVQSSNATGNSFYLYSVKVNNGNMLAASTQWTDYAAITADNLMNTDYLTFSGNWVVADGFKGVKTACGKSGSDSVSFDFTGTGLKIEAQINNQDKKNASGSAYADGEAKDGVVDTWFQNDNVYISIDGGEAQKLDFKPTEAIVGYGYVYESTTISEGAHTAVITTQESTTDNEQFYLKTVSVGNGELIKWNTTNAYIENSALNEEYFTFNGAEWKYDNVANMGHAAKVTSTNRSMEFKFTGTGLRLTAFVNCQDPDKDGIAEKIYTNDNVYISIDGGTPQPLNVVSQTHKVGFYAVYENAGLSQGTHTAVITSGARNNSSAGYDFSLQSVSVANGNVKPIVESWNKTNAIVDDALNTAYFNYSPNWAKSTSNPDKAFAQIAGDTVSFWFNGSALKVNAVVNYQDKLNANGEAYAENEEKDGIADTSYVNDNVYISIDDGQWQKMNLLNASVTPGNVGTVYEVKGLTRGNHTAVIKVENSATAKANHVYFESVEVGDGNVIKQNSLPAHLISAVVTDPESWQIKLTFSEPTHIFNSNAVWLCDSFSPTPGTNGSYQSGVASINYIDPITNVEDTHLYSTEMVITFEPYEDYTAIPANAGIRFVEYSQTADHNNGTVSPKVVKTYDGNEIYANRLSGTVDILWQNFTFEGNTIYPLYADNAGEKTVDIIFTEPVSLSNISKVLADNTAVASAVAKNGGTLCDTYTLTLSQDVSDCTKISFAADSFTDAYGREIVAKDVYLDPWADPEVDLGEQNTLITSGSEYNFMNCDTGRSITVSGTDEFVLTAVEGKTNVYTLTDKNGKYIDISGETPKISDEEQTVLIYPCENDRYQLIIMGKVVISDTDQGTDNSATLGQSAKEDSAVIESGWYITESGKQRPLRIMPLGDSNVFGTNPDLDGAEIQVGYRKELSEKLTEYFGRVVFTGDQRSAVTTVAETALLRHAAYPGYVIEDVWGDPLHPGVKPLLSGLTSKYAPDVVLLSLGGNDCGMMSGGGYSSAEMDEQMVRYENFIKEIEASMDDNDILFCSTLIPAANGVVNDIKEEHSQKLKAVVQKLSDEGSNIAVGDTRSVLAGENLEDILSSDGVHLSVYGSSVLADAWYDIITAAYGANSVKKTYSVTTTGEGFSVTGNDNATGIKPGNSYFFGIEIKEGYEGTPVVKADGKNLAAENGMYSLKNMLDNSEISVTGLSLKEYEVTVNVGEGGKANIESGTYEHGAELKIKLTPDEGYKVSTIEVNGVVKSSDAEYTLKVIAESEIEITFEKLPVEDNNEENNKNDESEKKDEETNKSENENKEDMKETTPATGDINIMLIVATAAVSLGAVLILTKKKYAE